MSRLSIELTAEEHQKIKAIAALQGSSIRDYVLERILPSEGEDMAALQELEAFLAPRIKDALEGNVISSSAQSIFEETLSDQ
ncbi:MAG: antitoxin [Alphaproteobacteria bacterium]